MPRLRKILKSRRTRDLRILIGRSVINHLDKSTKSCAAAPETGGIFIGCYRGPHIELTDFTTQGLNDISGNLSFHKRDKSHQSAASKAWRESRGTHTWLGEWHTHPSGGPSPSGTDLNSWRRLTDHSASPMVFAVVSPAGWKAFLSMPFEIGIRQMELAESGETGDIYGLSLPLITPRRA